jgi:hypothetical protein
MPTRSPGETTSETRSSTWLAAKLFEMSRAASEPGTGRGHYLTPAIVSGRNGSPQEENVEGPPRQAPRTALDRGAAGEYLPAMRLAEARAPRLPDLRHL